MNETVTSIAEEIENRWKPYPAYKDSGIEWLGEIPQHWTSVRLRHACKRITDGSHHSPPVVPDGLPYVTVRDLKDGVVDIDGAARISREDFEKLERNGCKPIIGDVLFSKDGTIGKVAVVNRDDFVVLSSLAILRPHREIESRFLGFFLSSVSGESQIESRFAGAALRRITLDVIVDLEMCIPTFPEQRTIASFLDHETTHIDALIAKKERLIELLIEKRSALISHAVTKGLDPTVPMKESGVEWLGEVPAHWNVKRNKAIFREHNRRSVSGEEELLTVSHITGVTQRSEKTVTMIEAESHEDYKLCALGDLVINTMWCWMGALGIAWESGMVSPSYNVYRPIEPNLCSRYFDYLCRIPIYVSEMTRYSKGVWKSRLRLYPEEFLLICTPLPNLAEQRVIVSFLDYETTKIDALISKIRAHIEKLKEYRTALISAAVTGKIDVREEVSS